MPTCLSSAPTSVLRERRRGRVGKGGVPSRPERGARWVLWLGPSETVHWCLWLGITQSRAPNYRNALVGGLQSTFHSRTLSKDSNHDSAKLNSALSSSTEATLRKISAWPTGKQALSPGLSLAVVVGVTSANPDNT